MMTNTVLILDLYFHQNYLVMAITRLPLAEDHTLCNELIVLNSIPKKVQASREIIVI